MAARIAPETQGLMAALLIAYRRTTAPGSLALSVREHRPTGGGYCAPWRMLHEVAGLSEILPLAKN